MFRLLHKLPRRRVREIVEDDQGVTAIEYGLIASSVALAFVAIAVLLGDDVESMFTTLSDAVQQATESGD